jgi:hypothetical protein
MVKKILCIVFIKTFVSHYLTLTHILAVEILDRTHLVEGSKSGPSRLRFGKKLSLLAFSGPIEKCAFCSNCNNAKLTVICQKCFNQLL